jgi:hypothetical protein
MLLRYQFNFDGDYGYLECNASLSDRSLSAFQRNLLPRHSGWKSKPSIEKTGMDTGRRSTGAQNEPLGVK